MEFIKMHGLGNDFILIDFLKKGLRKNLSGFAKKVCDRHFGIGGDGLILVLPSKKAEFRMKIFNPDGSEAEMCGNGIRCFAKYVYDKGLSKKKIISVETKAGIIIVKLLIKKGKVKEVEVDMGKPRLKRKDIPMLGNPDEEVINSPFSILNSQFYITCVSMGNPHCIVFIKDVDSIDISEIGCKIENHYLFPKRTNVEFVEIINRNKIKVRVWERGVGETLACGTGACAAVVASVLNKKTSNSVKVYLLGGILRIIWRNFNHIYLIGPAERVFYGIL